MKKLSITDILDDEMYDEYMNLANKWMDSFIPIDEEIRLNAYASLMREVSDFNTTMRLDEDK